jgi:hypothetical protein
VVGIIIVYKLISMLAHYNLMWGGPFVCGGVVFLLGQAGRLPLWRAPKFLVRPKRVQLCQKAEVRTWCRSQVPALKGGERGVLKALGLD